MTNILKFNNGSQFNFDGADDELKGEPMATIIPTVFDKEKGEKLTVEELAEALYEGSPHLEFMMHTLARQYGKPGVVLPPYHAQDERAKDFFRRIACDLIKYAIDGDYIKEEIDAAQ